MEAVEVHNITITLDSQELLWIRECLVTAENSGEWSNAKARKFGQEFILATRRHFGETYDKADCNV